MMISIEKFVFNSFGVNTYVISGKSRECVIVDPGCHSPAEEQQLSEYIQQNHLTPFMLVNTHFHVDHVLGNTFVGNTYGLKPVVHKAGKMFWETVREFGSVFGFDIRDIKKPENFTEEGDVLKAGDIELRVIYTPGHADGSICLINDRQRFVITGDVLFFESIGRSDMPTGNYDLLKENILNKLFTLPPDYTVYPGHGPQSSIGYEKLNNPFI
jgi:glyoxylase-like metal-dependent hydrolase (beta-lactamase superfamily II)